MNLNNFKSAMTLKANNSALVLQKHSPEILLGFGIAGIVTSTVLACKATLKAQDVMLEAKKEKDHCYLVRKYDGTEDTNGNLVEYSEEDLQRDLSLIALKTAVEFVKLYGPSVAIGVFSISMMVKSRNILSRRNAALLAAYKTLDEAYKRYRERVRDELGEDVDEYFRKFEKDPNKKFKLLIKDEDTGEEKEFELTEEEKNMIDFGASQYAKVFDASSPQWRDNNEANIFFLKAQQTQANVSLTTRGHLFLNEVYDMLGIPRTKAGAVVGWVRGHGDDVVDFGLFRSVNDFNDDFLNGYNRNRILLDFNVDGPIWDII